MEYEEIVVLEEICSTIADTLVLYRKHMLDGKYHDARHCLDAIDELTRQAHRIEDHPRFQMNVSSSPLYVDE